MILRTCRLPGGVCKTNRQPLIRGRRRKICKSQIVGLIYKGEQSSVGRSRMALLAAEHGARTALVARLLLRVVLLCRSSRADGTRVGGAGVVVIVFIFVDPVVVLVVLLESERFVALTNYCRPC
jgi:hypothetical protein